VQALPYGAEEYGLRSMALTPYRVSLFQKGLAAQETGQTCRGKAVIRLIPSLAPVLLKPWWRVSLFSLMCAN
jgi:hypothetical protein